jgi:hypothetical protein
VVTASYSETVEAHSEDKFRTSPTRSTTENRVVSAAQLLRHRDLRDLAFAVGQRQFE